MHDSHPPVVRAQLILLATAWIGLSLGVIIVIASTFSVLLGPIGAELGWDRAQLALAYSLFSLTSTLALPAVGRVVDSLGPRRVIVICAAMFAAIAFGLRLVTQLWQFYLLFVLLGIFSGGTSTLPYFKVLVASFSARRGLALGIANSGAAAGMFTFPLIAFHLNEQFGWRNAYLAMGTGVAVLTAAVILIGMRGRYLEVAASAPRVDAAGGFGRSNGPNFTLGAAMRTPAFLRVGLSFFVATTVLVGYLIHLVPLLNDRGVSAHDAAFAASIFGIGQLAGRLCAGYLLDRVASRYVVAGLWSVAMLAFVLLWSGITGLPLFICTALMGVAFGGEGDVLAYLVGELFGADSFGRIYSLLLMINLLGAVAGPYLFGVAFGASGSYTVVLGLAALCLAVSVGIALSVREADTHRS